MVPLLNVWIRVEEGNAKMLHFRLTLLGLMSLFITGLLSNMFPFMAVATTVDVKVEDDNYITYVFIPSE